MMMRVPTLIVRRRGQSAVGLPLPPVRLTLELSPVTGSALGYVDLGAALHELSIAGIELLRWRRSLREKHEGYDREYDCGCPDTHTEFFFLQHRFVSPSQARGSVPSDANARDGSSLREYSASEGSPHRSSGSAVA